MQSLVSLLRILAPPNTPPLFWRGTLELIATGLTVGLLDPFAKVISSLTNLLGSFWKLIYKEERPFRIAGYVLFLILIVLFFWADAISIVSSLPFLGLSLEGRTVPEFLVNFDLAVLMGSFLTCIVSGLLLEEILSKVSHFSDWDEREGFWKRLAKAGAVLLFLSSLLVVFNLGLAKLSAFEDLRASLGPTFTTFLNTVTSIVVPLNTVLATVLIFPDGAIKGGIFVLFLSGNVLKGILYILTYILRVFAFVFPFLLDIGSRLIYIVFDLVFYILFAPIEAVRAIFEWLKRLFGGE